MSSYPKSFSYYLSRMNNFSRQRIRINPLANTTFSANDVIGVDLPQALNDLTTLTLQGKASTNDGLGQGVYLPFAESLIESYTVEIGGQTVPGSFTNYGDLFKIFRDYQMEDKRNFRKILQLEDKQPNPLVDTAVTSGEPFAIYNWLGFLGTVPILDTTLMPPVRIYFRLAPTAVLAKNSGNANVPSYKLSDVRVNIDILDVADGVYYNMIQQRLAQAPLEIPFTTYQSVSGGTGGGDQSLRWSTSADCLEAVIATFKKTGATNAPNIVTKQSDYFTRAGTNITTSVFKVNGIPYPSIPCETGFGEVFIDTAHTLGASQDTLGSTDAGMSSHTAWTDNYFVHAHSFTYPDSEDSHRLVGISGRNNALLGTWETKGTATNVTPLMWLKCKSILRIGSGRFVEFIQ